MAPTEGAGRLLVLTGPIGAGKTSVAAELLKRFRGPTAYIEGDEFWKFIAQPKPGPHHADFRIILRAMGATAAAFARGGYETLLDFSIPLDYLARAGRLFDGVAMHVVVLRPAMAACVERAAARKAGAISYDESFAEFYRLFANAEESRVLANDDIPPAAAAERILAGLDAGSFAYAPQRQPPG